MIAGVASGIAAYFDVDVTVVRIAIAVLSVFGGAGIALYIAGWLLMPNEGTDQLDREPAHRDEPAVDAVMTAARRSTTRAMEARP